MIFAFPTHSHTRTDALAGRKTHRYTDVTKAVTRITRESAIERY